MKISGGRGIIHRLCIIALCGKMNIYDGERLMNSISFPISTNQNETHFNIECRFNEKMIIEIEGAVYIDMIRSFIQTDIPFTQVIELPCYDDDIVYHMNE